MKIVDYLDKNMSRAMIVSFLLYAFFIEAPSMTLYSTFDSPAEIPKWFKFVSGLTRSMFFAWVEFALSTYSIAKWNMAFDDGTITIEEIKGAVPATFMMVLWTILIAIISMVGADVIQPTEESFFVWNKAMLGNPAAISSLLMIIGSLGLSWITVLFRRSEIGRELAEKEQKKKEKEEKVYDAVKDNNTRWRQLLSRKKPKTGGGGDGTQPKKGKLEAIIDNIANKELGIPKIWSSLDGKEKGKIATVYNKLTGSQATQSNIDNTLKSVLTAVINKRANED